MAGGWARDGAEQEQIDATIMMRLQKARQGLSHNEDGEAALYCEECGEPIPQARRESDERREIFIFVASNNLRKKSKALELFNRRYRDSHLILLPLIFYLFALQRLDSIFFYQSYVTTSSWR